jgi:hypothetical protein
MGTAHQQHLQQNKLYHRLPHEKSEYCQQISQRKSLSVTSGWLVDWCLTFSEQFFSYIQSLVRPSLEYSIAVWDAHQQQDTKKSCKICH